MAFGKLPTYKVAELEKRASAYLAKHFGSPVAVPVDIDWLVEQGEGIDLTNWPKTSGR